jgi:hypothetical protein
VTSFRGIPFAKGFAKRYELHYQLRKIDVDGVEVQGQYGCLNFHAKRGNQWAKLTVAVKNKWSGAWTQAWFYCMVPLVRSPSPGRGKGIYALHSCMSGLEFVMEPPFECSENDAGDVAFVKATNFIGSRDAVEEYMACRLFPLLANFGLGEVTDGETPASKQTLPLPESRVARHAEDTSDSFRVRVELTSVNVVGRYARGGHDTCIAVVSNNGRVNRVFEQAGVPDGPRLVPGSEASKGATKKRKSNAGAGPTGKRTKVSDRKVVPLKEPMASKGAGAASSKTAMAKVVPAKSLPHVGAVPGASAPPKVGAPFRTVVSKATGAMATPKSAPKARVLKISTGTKRSSAASLPMAKGKQASVDATPHKTVVRPPCLVESDEG